MKTFVISNDKGDQVLVRAPSAAEAYQALADEAKRARAPLSKDELGKMNIRVANERDHEDAKMKRIDADGGER